mgnify:CR=1 FL=1
MKRYKSYLVAAAIGVAVVARAFGYVDEST